MTTFTRRSSRIALGLAILSLTSLTGMAVMPFQTLTVTGKVTLKQADGTEVPFNPNVVFQSGGTVTTAQKSSAVVSLGKLGRVEVQGDTSVKIEFTDSTVTATLVNSPRGRATIKLVANPPETSAQGPGGPSGQLTAVGKVQVNGTNAISGASVFSDSTVTTAKGSSAVVSLGKLGRVEVSESSRVSLNFDGTRVVAMLEAGRVRVSTSSGI